MQNTKKPFVPVIFKTVRNSDDIKNDPRVLSLTHNPEKTSGLSYRLNLTPDFKFHINSDFGTMMNSQNIADVAFLLNNHVVAVLPFEKRLVDGESIYFSNNEQMAETWFCQDPGWRHGFKLMFNGAMIGSFKTFKAFKKRLDGLISTWHLKQTE